jgi:FtsH-binding integral membrane protein
VADPFDFVGVQELRFERPVHQEILAVLLVVLITVSAIMAVSMRDVSDLIVGIGSLVLGIWGVRSVLVPSTLGVVTSIDLALSLVILIVLLGLSLRAAQHFRKTSELPKMPITIRRRRKRGDGTADGETTRRQDGKS